MPGNYKNEIHNINMQLHQNNFKKIKFKKKQLIRKCEMKEFQYIF